jgi:hypothetical protein
MVTREELVLVPLKEGDIRVRASFEGTLMVWQRPLPVQSSLNNRATP